MLAISVRLDKNLKTSVYPGDHSIKGVYSIRYNTLGNMLTSNAPFNNLTLTKTPEQWFDDNKSVKLKQVKTKLNYCHSFATVLSQKTLLNKSR